MTREEKDMIGSAENSLRGILVCGLEQGHRENDWVEQPINQHVLQAIGHASMAERMRQGHKAEDAEGAIGHMERALCRTAMALWLMRQDARLP